MRYARVILVALFFGGIFCSFSVRAGSGVDLDRLMDEIIMIHERCISPDIEWQSTDEAVFRDEWNNMLISFMPDVRGAFTEREIVEKLKRLRGLISACLNGGNYTSNRLLANGGKEYTFVGGERGFRNDDCPQMIKNLVKEIDALPEPDFFPDGKNFREITGEKVRNILEDLLRPSFLSMAFAGTAGLAVVVLSRGAGMEVLSIVPPAVSGDGGISFYDIDVGPKAFRTDPPSVPVWMKGVSREDIGKFYQKAGYELFGPFFDWRYRIVYTEDQKLRKDKEFEKISKNFINAVGEFLDRYFELSYKILEGVELEPSEWADWWARRDILDQMAAWRERGDFHIVEVIQDDLFDCLAGSKDACDEFKGTEVEGLYYYSRPSLERALLPKKLPSPRRPVSISDLLNIIS